MRVCTSAQRRAMWPVQGAGPLRPSPPQQRDVGRPVRTPGTLCFTPICRVALGDSLWGLTGPSTKQALPPEPPSLNCRVRRQPRATSQGGRLPGVGTCGVGWRAGSLPIGNPGNVDPLPRRDVRNHHHLPQVRQPWEERPLSPEEPGGGRGPRTQGLLGGPVCTGRGWPGRAGAAPLTTRRSFSRWLCSLPL